MPTTGKRGKYLGFVAHEIKNPLATALWSCDLLKRMEGSDRTGERADKMLDVSLRALRRMRRLIDDYFTIERLLEQGYELRRERVALKDLVDQCVQVLRDKDGIATESWSVDIGEVVVAGDAEMLRRGLRAVLEHLARAAPKPRLSLIGRADGDTASLTVRAETPPSPLVPPIPEERPSGDPLGAVLGYALTEHVLAAHGGKLEERDGALQLTLPVAR